MIRSVRRGTDPYCRTARHAIDIKIYQNETTMPRLPTAFDGFALPHLNDLHLDMD